MCRDFERRRMGDLGADPDFTFSPIGGRRLSERRRMHPLGIAVRVLFWACAFVLVVNPSLVVRLLTRLLG